MAENLPNRGNDDVHEASTLESCNFSWLGLSNFLIDYLFTSSSSLTVYRYPGLTASNLLLRHAFCSELWQVERCPCGKRGSSRHYNPFNNARSCQVLCVSFELRPFPALRSHILLSCDPATLLSCSTPRSRDRIVIRDPRSVADHL